MHLVSLKNQAVRIGDIEIAFKLGESIWTESSYKYTPEEFAQLAATAGFSVERVWTDPRQFFSAPYIQKAELYTSRPSSRHQSTLRTSPPCSPQDTLDLAKRCGSTQRPQPLSTFFG